MSCPNYCLLEGEKQKQNNECSRKWVDKFGAIEARTKRRLVHIYQTIVSLNFWEQGVFINIFKHYMNQAKEKTFTRM